MGFTQKKNTPLQDRRFSRAIARMNRFQDDLQAAVMAQILNPIAAALFGDNPIEKALRAFRKRYQRRYGLYGTLFSPNWERECARRRAQIAKGMLTESNGLVRTR